MYNALLTTLLIIKYRQISKCNECYHRTPMQTNETIHCWLRDNNNSNLTVEMFSNSALEKHIKIFVVTFNKQLKCSWLKYISLHLNSFYFNFQIIYHYVEQYKTVRTMLMNKLIYCNRNKPYAHMHMPS